MPKVTKKTKKDEREVQFEQVTIDLCSGDTAVTAEDAKVLLGWEEETEGGKFTDVLCKDYHGKKIKCGNNIINRPLTYGNCLLYAKEILLGNWAGPNGSGGTVNGEPIIVGRTGLMLNGQHQLIGLILAVQMWQDDKERWPHWAKEPVIDKVVVSGVSEDDRTVNTMDTAKPRTLDEVIDRSECFKALKPHDRRRCSKFAAVACKIFKFRAGHDLNAFTPKWTMAEYMDLIGRHPRLLDCVNHVYQEDGGEKRLSRYLGPGTVAGFMYLMAVSNSDGSKEGDYRSSDRPSENDLNFDNYKKAEEFITLIAGDAAEVKAYRQKWAVMLQANQDSSKEKWALLVNAWGAYNDKGKITESDLRLEYTQTEEGANVLTETPSVGGIDLGDPNEVDEEMIPARDPTPKAIEKGKEKVKAKNGKASKANPTLIPSRAGDSWDIGDIAWVRDNDGDHYLAEVTEAPFQPDSGDEEITVRDQSGGEWYVVVKDLSLAPPVAAAPKPMPRVATGKKGPKADAEWKTGDVAWVKDSDEPWRGKITEITLGKDKKPNMAKLTIMTGHKGAGNAKAAWLKNLSRKQPQVA